MNIRSIAIEDLRLDSQNPRHGNVPSQRDIISALLTEGGEKMVVLAGDIAAKGLNPMDVALVIQDGPSAFTALEGNRRLAVLKLLLNPSLAKGHAEEKAFVALSKGPNIPTEVNCVVVESREAAAHWLLIRHTGENEGAGTVRWSTAAQQRFNLRMNTQAGHASAFLDSVAHAYPGNSQLLESLNKVRAKKSTTLGRLLTDPYVRGRLGLEFEGAEVFTHYAAVDLESAIVKLVSDIAGELSVTKIKNKEQRKAYIDGLRNKLPDPSRFAEDAALLSRSGPARPRRKAKRKPTPPDKWLLMSVTVSRLSQKVAAIISELQRLDIERFPNTAGVLLRVILELVIDDALTKKNLVDPQDKLKDKLRKALNLVDKTQKDQRFAALRAGLTDGTSLYSIRTIHAYVHNQYYHPTPSELRSIAANMSEFIQSIDGLLP